MQTSAVSTTSDLPRNTELIAVESRASAGPTAEIASAVAGELSWDPAPALASWFAAFIPEDASARNLSGGRDLRSHQLVTSGGIRHLNVT